MGTRDELFVLATLATLFLLLKRQKMTWQVARNGHAYFVKNLPDRRRAADRLAELEEHMREFVRKALERHPAEPRLLRIRDKWTGTLAEVEDTSENVAYSLNKSIVHVCMREEDGSLADLNTSCFVLLHELAHVATLSFNHTAEFWTNFKYLLELAEQTGSYTYVDHDKMPAMLCGRVLGASPMSCVKNKTCASQL